MFAARRLARSLPRVLRPAPARSAAATARPLHTAPAHFQLATVSGNKKGITKKNQKSTMPEFKVDHNVFIESDIQSSEYDGVVYILYPDELKVEKPRHIGSFINNVLKIDQHITKAPTVWNCEYVAGGRLILAPTGNVTPYKDVRVMKEAAKKGIERALEAGVKKPLLVVQPSVEFPEGQLVAILGALETLYQPIQARERDSAKETIYKIGFLGSEQLNADFKKTVTNAVLLENARIFTRDICGADPERMTPQNIVEHVNKSFAGNSSVKITVVDDQKDINKDYPLLAAVARASNQIARHSPRVVYLEYAPSDLGRVTETVYLVGKGVTYDTGGADIKVGGKMTGMSRDKGGAAAVAGFVKACSLLKPVHLKVVGVLCLCRNSCGEDSYVTDEILVSASGKTVRVKNTDAEGRLAMADALFKVANKACDELNPHIYTIATLTGHAVACYGRYTAAMDNHSAKKTSHSSRLQLSGQQIGEGVEVSTIRAEDLDVNNGKGKGIDLLQFDPEVKSRGHQLAAGFLIKVSGLENKNVKYTHLDIAGAAGELPHDPTAEPVLSLCHLHKVLF